MTPAEFNTYWLPLGDALYRVALYLLEDKQDAEDAVQDLFLKLWEGSAQLESIKNPKAYAVTMMRNLCLDRIRVATRRPHESLSEQIPLFATHEDEFVNRDRLDRVMKAIESLPDRQKRVLILRTLDGLDYEDIARKEGMSPLNARVQLSSARKRLKELIQKE